MVILLDPVDDIAVKDFLYQNAASTSIARIDA